MKQNTDWSLLGDAVTTYDLEPSLLLQWLEDGEIRSEHFGTRTMKIHVHDLELKIQACVQ